METLMKSQCTSWRHIFPLISSQNLEIHRVFLQFFHMISEKFCSSIRTPFLIHRFPRNHSISSSIRFTNSRMVLGGSSSSI